MITLEKIKKEIKDTLEHGCMTQECLKDLTMLYYVEERMEKEEHHHAYEEKHHGKMDRQTAQYWVDNMKNADGSTGGHYSIAETNMMLKNHGWNCDPVEFWVAVNAMWSDGVETARMFGVDRDEYWAARGREFLMDADAWPDKLERYYWNVVKRE